MQSSKQSCEILRPDLITGQIGGTAARFCTSAAGTQETLGAMLCGYGGRRMLDMRWKLSIVSVLELMVASRTAHVPN